ncbi:hypothetical protein AB0H03_30030 [Streptomyces sparsogenes]|uniref:hypothetical protein n=1 Tax=Streptomyces sparsogenes TaxID=67365 RepID=UPI00340D7635
MSEPGEQHADRCEHRGSQRPRYGDAVVRRNPERAAEAMAGHLRSSRVRHRTDTAS